MSWYNFAKPEQMTGHDRARFAQLQKMSRSEKEAEVQRLRKEARERSITAPLGHHHKQLDKEAHYLLAWIEAEETGKPRPLEPLGFTWS